MNNLEEEIARSLAEEEKDLAIRLGDEPSFLSQMKGNFTGPGGWIFTLSYVANVAFFLLFLFSAYRVVMASDALSAVQWSVGCLSSLILAVYFKTSLSQRNEANRLLRELRLLHAEMVRGEKS